MNKLETGQYIIRRNVLPQSNLQKLRNVAERLDSTDSRPIYIAQETLLGGNTVDRYRSAGLESILNEASPWLKAMIGERCLILTNKVLLRRTWPLSERKARNLGHNASNLTWHQDSNYKHGANPMVVMMTSLQDRSGQECPGLSILESPTNQFEGVFGYEGNRVSEFQENMSHKYGEFKVSNPTLDAGDLLIFNGLTFHRTFSRESMKSHRDALLVRAVKPEDANNFPQGHHLIIKTY